MMSRQSIVANNLTPQPPLHAWRGGVSRQAGGGEVKLENTLFHRAKPLKRIALSLRKIGLEWPFKSLCVLLLCITACVPATVPPQLDHTPGPAVRLSDQVYESDIFRVNYPPGWRVITSAATSDTAVILAAPAGDALLIVGPDLTEAPPPADYTGSLRSERSDIALGTGQTITVILNAAAENWATYRPLLDAVAESVALPASSNPAT